MPNRFILLYGLICFTALATDSAQSQTAQENWSFNAAVRPEVPPSASLKHGDRVHNPIDAFVLQQLEKSNLSPAPLADKQTLVRRAYIDLIGLPPSPDQVSSFVNNSSETAWIDLINALLASQHYGERWGRHWLDVARYADSGGFEGDISYPHAWRYRDYVVKAFNDDRPYNVFVQEQIAGDELWPNNLDLDPRRVYLPSAEQLRHQEARKGTGLFGFGPRVAESTLDARRFHYETLTDWVDTTASVFMGLTLGCARCHEHKFDPLTQEDYFSMQAIFASSLEVEESLQTPIEIVSWQWVYPRTVAVHEARLAYKHFQNKTAGRELTPSEKKTAGVLRDAIVTKVMELPETNISVPNSAFDPLSQIPKMTVLGHDHSALLKPVHFLDRGELSRPRQLMPPAIPNALAVATQRKASINGPFGSRREFALWLTGPGHPLTSRVMVNRLWQWHMGRGLVATPNDFGNMGSLPTHPELLDWLALEFVERGWSMKEMHRVIMLSSTYQMTSRYGPAEHLAVDPNNELLWRMSRRRVEAETLWDSVHTVAGTINLKMGGRPVVPPLAEDEIAALREKWQWPVSGDPTEHTRRGLYVLVLRNFRFPMFEVFDAPVNSTSCPERDVTTVAPQALWTLNSPTVFEQAKHLADRVLQEAGPDPTASIQRLWMISLARQPRLEEQQEALALWQQLATASGSAGDEDTQRARLEPLPAALRELPPSEAAARIKLSLAVFNLSEFAFVD